MTRKQRATRQYNARFHAKKKAMGWKYCSFLLPPEVLTGLLAAKARLMTEWREKQGEVPEQESPCEPVGD